ncbi:MAG: ABC transporter permease, partial [Nitrospirae bacterium]|nr:ABC transporter permease [Nitrospirota bacterium]
MSETEPIPQHVPVIRIEPSRGWINLNLRDLWEYRELLYFLVWRDVKVRYKQTALGAAWAVLQPFMTMVVFTIFFGKLAKIPSDGIPYPVFAFAALLPWQLFAHSLNESS